MHCCWLSSAVGILEVWHTPHGVAEPKRKAFQKGEITMPRINAIDPQFATGTSKTLLDAVQQKLGFVPNFMRTLAVSPATLDAYLSFGDRLGQGILSPKLREQLAVTVAYSNSCH